MDADDYFWKNKKRPLKINPRSKPLPKVKEKYLEAEGDFEQSLKVLKLKYAKKFQFNSFKHWHFDFHFIECLHKAYMDSNIKKPLRINAPKWLIYMVGPDRLELSTNGL